MDRCFQNTFFFFKGYPTGKKIAFNVLLSISRESKHTNFEDIFLFQGDIWVFNVENKVDWECTDVSKTPPLFSSGRSSMESLVGWSVGRSVCPLLKKN